MPIPVSPVFTGNISNKILVSTWIIGYNLREGKVRILPTDCDMSLLINHSPLEGFERARDPGQESEAFAQGLGKPAKLLPRVAGKPVKHTAQGLAIAMGRKRPLA